MKVMEGTTHVLTHHFKLDETGRMFIRKYYSDVLELTYLIIKTVCLQKIDE